ncbi:MAG TPA: TVP38/TMEM64 family protein [Candidatus Paceibacterota bacterium]
MKLFIIVVFIGFLIFTWTAFDWQTYSENPELIRDALQKYPLWTPLIFFAFHTLAEVVLIPGGPFTVAGGLLFGTVLGTIYSLFSGMLATVILFWILRYTSGGSFFNYLQNRSTFVRYHNNKFIKHGFWHVLFIRLAPIVPANIINVGYGLSQIKFKDYVWASFLGNIPSTIILSWFGTRFIVWTAATIVVTIFVFIAIGTILSYLYQKMYLRMSD